MKIKTLTISPLTHLLNGEQHYRIEKVTDCADIAYTPGKVIRHYDVNDLCNSPRWKVNIVSAKA